MKVNRTRAMFGAAIILLAWLPMLAGPAIGAMWNWSTTASSNGSADPTINFREGQAPSSLNDSARALMAVVAGYRDDISGLLTTTGTASAYLVTTNSGLPNPPSDGQLLAVTVNVTNGVAPTLAADGGGAYPIQSAAGVAVGAATLISGSPYTLRFSAANSAWMLRNFYGTAFSVPLGGLLPSTLTTPPNSNFILPAGQCISTTTYATYWVALGSPASGACAGGQFKVIDLRGRVPAALDNLNGTPANILTSSAAGCGVAFTSIGTVCGGESQTLTLAQTPSGITVAGTVTVNPAAGGNIAAADGNVTGQLVSTGSPQVVAQSSFGTWHNAGVLSGAGTMTSNNTSGQAHPNVQPTVAVSYFLRVI